jgi:hypothetical protein
MLRSCVVCRAEASPDLQLQYCAVCLSALYCSEACQKIDWRKQHKKICKLLNVGHGDMQLRNYECTRRCNDWNDLYDKEQLNLNEEMKIFFRLFDESTFEGSRATARKMIAKRQTKYNQSFLLFPSLSFLIRCNTEALSWPSSPLLVMLQLVDPSVLSGGVDEPWQEQATRSTALHRLAYLVDPSEYSTTENQLILAKQLIEHGANVNAVTLPCRKTPLQNVCFAGVVTNLDFVGLLLKEGADPNAQDHKGSIAWMFTVPFAPGAAKFLLNWPTTDVSITTRSGESFHALLVRLVSAHLSEDQISLPTRPDQVGRQFLLQQWRDIEGMLVERGAGITAIL